LKRIKNAFRKTTTVGVSVVSILCIVAVIHPIDIAEANTKYPELDTDDWDCYGFDSNCGAFNFGC